MALDPNEPVLVGVAARSYRPGDGTVGSLIDLLVDATRAAAEDAGAPALLGRIGWVGVPKGAWTHADPGRELAARVGSPGAHTVLAEVGVLQQDVLDRACRAVQEGAVVALVAGAESAHGAAVGAPAAVIEARSAVSEPDEHVASSDFGISGLEVSAGFLDPPTVYAVIESAIAADHGWDAEEHRRRLGALWARFASVAAGNPAAWRTDAPSAEEIVRPSAANRMVATPYTKSCCSNNQVNQAAALLFTSAATAAALGISTDRWVFPRGSAVGNHPVPVLHRPSLVRSPNAAEAGRRALELAGAGVDDVALLDLYSCFPAAVQVGAAELGIDLDGDRAPTVTGGMSFAGGPLNSYVLHATAAMAERLRLQPDDLGLVTSVSGFITRCGAAVWAAAPGDAGWRSDDVTVAAAGHGPPPLPEVAADEATGPLVVRGATVEHRRHGSRRVVAVADDAEGRRAIVTSDAAELADAGVAVDDRWPA